MERIANATGTARVANDPRSDWWLPRSGLLIAVADIIFSLVRGKNPQHQPRLRSDVIAIVVGLFAGILAAARPGTWWDRVGMAGTSLGISIPDFWAAVLLSIFFAAKLGWFPVIGFTPITQNPLKWLHGLVLPALALGIPSSAMLVSIS